MGEEGEVRGEVLVHLCPPLLFAERGLGCLREGAHKDHLGDISGVEEKEGLLCHSRCTSKWWHSLFYSV